MVQEQVKLSQFLRTVCLTLAVLVALPASSVSSAAGLTISIGTPTPTPTPTDTPADTPTVQTGPALVNPNATTEARELFNYLASIYGKKSLLGYNVYPHTPDIYEQTGRHGAVWGRDLQWSGDMNEVARHALENRYILTFHWHWYFGGDSAWKNKRKSQVNVGAVVTPGTPEHAIALSEMSAMADKLQVLEDAGVPVLFRPLHEIDGGWFWWTDTAKPANTAALWRLMYDYFTRVRGLNNLIWVYSAGTGLDKDKAYRARFYPGAAYVDIAGIDVYDIDYRNAVNGYKSYFDVMGQVAPGKMLALPEADACPDPDKMAEGQTPAWLFCMPWWGTPNPKHPVDWAQHETSHDFMLTLDELPQLGTGPIKPAVGIVHPLDDGGARFNNNQPVIQAYATSRSGYIARVDFLADGLVVGSRNQPPYAFTWNTPPRGVYAIQARAVDAGGQTALSNTVHIQTGTADLAFGRRVYTSSGTNAKAVTDGSFYTGWQSDKNDSTPDEEWVYVDLGRVFTIDQVHSLWGWKLHPADYTIDVATQSPSDPASWTTVKRVKGSSYATWKKTLKDRFEPVKARYLRYHLTRRAGGQTWGGYDLRELSVPQATSTSSTATNRPPAFDGGAQAEPSVVRERKATLSLGAVDPDRDVPTYTWSVLSGPTDGVDIQPNGDIFAGKANAYFREPGAYTLRATVDDGRGGVVVSDVNVEVPPINGSALVDDRSSQSGNGLGEFETLSKWNRYAMRFLLPYGQVEKAVLRVYRKATDKQPVIFYAHSGLTDQWNEVQGPNPGQSDLLGTASSSAGGKWVEIDVTEFIANEALGDGVATIILSSDQSTWNTQVHSRQNPVNPPELVVTFR